MSASQSPMDAQMTKPAAAMAVQTATHQQPAQEKALDQVEYRIARSRDDREQAFRVLYQSYVKAGLAPPNEHGIRVSRHHLLEETVVIVGALRGEVVSTITLAMDGSAGLPIDTLYKDSIDELRKFGVRAAELCCLADRRTDAARGLEAVIEMSRLALFYAMTQDTDCLLLIAHPRHGRFYKRAMGFRAIDEIRECPYVQNRPAEPLLLNIPELKHYQPRLYDRYFSEPIAPERLQNHSVTPDDVAYFARYLEQ